MKPYFLMFAAYNRWANERLYEAAAKVPDADYRAIVARSSDPYTGR